MMYEIIFWSSYPSAFICMRLKLGDYHPYIFIILISLLSLTRTIVSHIRIEFTWYSRYFHHNMCIFSSSILIFKIISTQSQLFVVNHFNGYALPSFIGYVYEIHFFSISYSIYSLLVFFFFKYHLFTY